MKCFHRCNFRFITPVSGLDELTCEEQFSNGKSLGNIKLKTCKINICLPEFIVLIRSMLWLKPWLPWCTHGETKGFVCIVINTITGFIVRRLTHFQNTALKLTKSYNQGVEKWRSNIQHTKWFYDVNLRRPQWAMSWELMECLVWWLMCPLLSGS